ncbi:hypothetical protein [Antribacter gilvus]|uniref:hypothetical protein n=1 Tax=Antribacter gilvus TaxID=2304675 RepID=UPI000F774C2F|nr:hypothetical protein [Antribacter gilvus]
MARVKFLGPAGAPFVGVETSLVREGEGKIGDMADMQRQTGMRMKDIQAELERNESFGFQVALFLTLRAAGHKVSFDTAGNFAEADLEIVEDPGDQRDDDAEDVPEAEDPTSAPTASGRGDVDAEEPTAAAPGARSRSRQQSPGSKKRSTSGS